MKEITTFDVFIDEESELGVDKISLVRKPAILTDFVYLNEEEQIEAYKQVSLSDDEKRIITGPALIPNMEIIRKDEDGDPYYIKYSEEQIEKIIQKFFKAKDQYSVNKDHKTDVNDVYIYESWIVGENDKSKDLGFDLPKGTWMVSMKVEDDEIWNGVKSGKYKGFSIEGLFKFKRNSKLVKQKKWSRKNIKSANVDRVMFNDENNELVVQFNDGSRYTYFDVNFPEFFSVVDGLAECKTEGENKWGSWFVGKTPSVGAAVWEYLINTGKAYTKGGTFQEEVALVYPKAGESEDEFIGRCMSDLQGEYEDQDQRLAVCYTYWEKQSVELESYTDYPESAKNNAKRALEWAEKNGWGECGTPVGKQRANQLAKGEPISEETISRMASFERHRQNKDVPYSEGCGGLMWDAWGGTSGIEWAQNKLEKIRQEKLNLEKDTKNKNINMVSAILKDGSTLYTDADAMEVGVDVYFMNGEEKIKPEAGEYALEDGSTVVVGEDGKIAEIKSMETETVESADMKDKEDKEEKETMGYGKDKEKTKMEIDPMLMEQFDALKGMIENLNLKIDTLIGAEMMSAVKQSVENLEVKVEKLSVEAEMKLVDTVDSKKKIAQSELENKKRALDYNLITRLNRKF